MPQPFTLSIVMPALNEEKNIQKAVLDSLSAMKTHGIEGEIIVVNDGSRDRTAELVEVLQKTHPEIRLLQHSRPMGIGYSFMDGVRNASKEIVVLIPGDAEVMAESCLKYIYLMRHVDIVVPFFFNTEIRDRRRRLISAIYRFIINVSFGVNLNYTNGTVLYRRDILSSTRLFSTGFLYQAEILVKLIRQGYLFAEVPSVLTLRLSGKSKATSLKSLIDVMKSYLKLLYHIHVLRVDSRKNIEKLSKASISHRLRTQTILEN